MSVAVAKKEIVRLDRYVPEIGERHIICDWQSDDEMKTLVDHARLARVLGLVDDKAAERVMRALENKDGRIPTIRAGLGYEELLSSSIVDGSAIASSSTEAFLVPASLLPPNYLQPGGIPGRTLRLVARGRHTTLTTAATLIFKWGSALTNVIPTTTWCVSGGITMDTTIQTATMWSVDAVAVVRSINSAGTVFAMGGSLSAAQAVTIANQTADFMGSAGSATPAAVTVDMTVAQFLSLTAKWSLATAYSIQCHQLLLEALN